MTRRVLTVAAMHMALAYVLLEGRPLSARPAEAVAFVAAFALAGLAPLQIELGRHSVTVTLTEAVLVLACYRLNPTVAVGAAVLGEALACLSHRQGPLKMTFNLAAAAGATAVGVAVFSQAQTGHGTTSPGAWTAVALAVTAYALVNHVSTSVVLALVGDRPVRSVFVGALAPALSATAVSLSIGLVGELLFETHAAAPLLLTPVVGAAMLAVRRVTAQQSEHLRFTRLYESSRRSAGLQALDATLVTLASESCVLVGGRAALCAAPGTDGAWRAMIVDGGHARPVEPASTSAIRSFAGDGGAREMRAADLPWAVRGLVPSSTAVVVAAAPGTGPDGHGGALLVVYREVESDGGGRDRAEVLSAFAAHAGLVAANARLLHEVEDALRRQVDLNRQKEEFVAVVSHELRTPLTVMLGALGTMRRLGEDASGDRSEKLAVMAETHGLRLKRLIEDLLLAGSIEEVVRHVDVERVDLVGFVDQMVAEMATSVSVPLHAPRALAAATCLADPIRLRQIVGNFVENAAKYGAGSPIAVAVSVSDDGVAQVAVMDHGPGVPLADRERVFDRFVQLDSSSTRPVGGTGLGLYVSRKLAASMRGTITLGETPGGGCTITLHLPASSLPADRFLETVAFATTGMERA